MFCCSRELLTLYLIRSTGCWQPWGVKWFFVICVPHYFLLFCGTLYVWLLQIVSIYVEYLSRPIDKVIGIHKNVYLDKQWPVILKSFINHTTKLIECNIPWLSIVKEGIDCSCSRFSEVDLSCHSVSSKTWTCWRYVPKMILIKL